MNANPTLRLALGALLLTLGLAGCGSLLVAVGSDPIAEDPGERTLAQQVLDESIETKATVNIKAADDRYRKAKLLVVSYNGYVLLTGEVSDQALKDQAADVVRKINGVRRIYNELVIGPSSDSNADANDVWLTTKVKTALITTSNTPGMRVKVVTENGVVYLMGLLTAEEAERVSDTVAGIIGVQRVVRLFELI